MLRLRRRLFAGAFLFFVVVAAVWMPGVTSPDGARAGMVETGWDA